VGKINIKSRRIKIKKEENKETITKRKLQQK